MNDGDRISLLKYELNLGNISVEYVPSKDNLVEKLYELFQQISSHDDLSFLDDTILKWFDLHSFVRITNGGSRVMDIRLLAASWEFNVHNDNIMVFSLGTKFQQVYDAESLSVVDANLAKYERGESYSDRLRIKVSRGSEYLYLENVQLRIPINDRRFRNLARKSYFFGYVLFCVPILDWLEETCRGMVMKKTGIISFIPTFIIGTVLVAPASFLISIARVTFYCMVSWMVPEWRPRGYFWRERKRG